MNYEIEILSRPVDNGAGWRLRLLERGEQVGEVGFLIADDACDIESALQTAYCNAQKEAQIWLEGQYLYNVRRDATYVIPAVLTLTGIVLVLFAILLVSEVLSP